MKNSEIAQKLKEHAEQLEQRQTSLYRARAYRRAASTIRFLDCSLEDLIKANGAKAAERLPGIGKSLALALERLIIQGEVQPWETDPRRADPEQSLTSLPGIGPQMAHRMYQELGITCVDEVERAAREGHLEHIGIGSKRLQNLLDAIEGRRARSLEPCSIEDEPSVRELLAIDAIFRNGSREAVAALMHQSQGWSYQAHYADHALAHRLGTEEDHVMIHFDNGKSQGERTIVTETRPFLLGQRVVRGREQECAQLFLSHAS